MILNYKTYLIESKKEDNLIDLYLSKRFVNILLKMDKNNKITSSFLNIINDIEYGSCDGKFDVSFVDVTESNDTISYILSSKAKPVLDKYKSINRLLDGANWCWVNNRQEQKLSRFVTRIFGKIFNLNEIQSFVDDYKMKHSIENNSYSFELVKGDDVKKYYHGNMYNSEENGQLQRSCMKYSECQNYFDIYINNPDKMNMLILKDDKDKIYGRANIWYLDEPEKRVFMDRIYTTYDWQIKLYIDYALKNNWLYKSKQIYGGSVIPLIDKGKQEKMIISVNLKPESYKYYPYIDTMQFYNPINGHLTSDVNKFNDNDYITLVLASGGYYIDQDGAYKIDYLGRIVHNHYLRRSKMDNVYIHANDAVYLEYKNDYVTPEHEFIQIDGYIYLKDDVYFDDKTNKYKIKK